MTALEEIKKALAAAEQFIVNGVELGYIRMPNPETPDSAHDTLPMIRQAQTALESLQRDLAACQEQAVKDGNEISRLKDWQAGAISCREAEQARIDEYKARAEAAEAEVKLIREAVVELLDQAEHVCLGAHTPLDIKEAAMNLADPIGKVQTALASTGGEHHAE